MAKNQPDSNRKIAHKKGIEDALRVLMDGDLCETGTGLFNALGYASERVADLDGHPQSFIKQYPSLSGQKGTKTEQFFLDNAEAVHIIFQVTDEEIQTFNTENLFAENQFNKGFTSSFLFVAVEMKSDKYARGIYADITREINKRLGMPTCVLFRNGACITLAFVDRRESKKQRAKRDVLGKVSLIRDINCKNPHRAHTDILYELSLDQLLPWMEQEKKPKNFDGLREAWLARLETEELNGRFYRELNEWFKRAVESKRVEFPMPEPKPEGTKISKEDHVIRLITRILFIWFAREKNLISEDLFVEEQVKPLLKVYSRENDDYYRAILQNLFFATLNTKMDKRGFGKKNNVTHHNFNLFRYKDSLVDPDKLLELMKEIPFINGGLFDCLDSEPAIKDGRGGYRLDCFSDNPKHREQLFVPNDLFFDEKHGLFPLLNKYKFTVEENTPIEQEVALDPELLGKVFENLLAETNPETHETARKQTGSYYTPREIVNYMVDEALMESLTENVHPTDDDMKFFRDRLRYLLDYADAFDDAEELFDDKEKHNIVRAIADLKVLDPAVGSGAFPMGMLHKLTLALGRLDPGNKIWKELQVDRATERSRGVYGDERKNEQERKNALEEINKTFQNYTGDFGRKLYLVQNSIFGVDIQPIACQIAKLRFFISLAIEQKLDGKKENRGIRPLPNLETRFVAADTLIGLGGKKDRDWLEEVNDIKRLIEQLRKNREQHFNASEREKKQDCMESDENLRSELATALVGAYKIEDFTWYKVALIVKEESKKLQNKLEDYERKMIPKAGTLLKDAEWDGITNKKQKKWQDKILELKNLIAKNEKLLIKMKKKEESIKVVEVWKTAENEVYKEHDEINEEAKKISEWDPYDQNQISSWFDPIYMFCIEKGFDIIIGNPPYVQLQKSDGLLGKRYKECDFETYTGTGDIYQLFYERGMDLLNNASGVLAFITSNSWMRTQYGEKLRNFFSTKHSPIQLIDIGKDAFEAVVDVNILLVRSGCSREIKQSYPAVDMDSVSKKNLPPAEKHWRTIQIFRDAPWITRSPEDARLKAKVEQVGVPLRDWDVKIKRGITTGCNDAFIIDTARRDELVAADPKSAEIIKPVLRGRNIQRYYNNWTGDYLIATLPALNVNIDNYPEVKCHLQNFDKRGFGAERLAQEGKELSGGGKSRKKTPHKWFELQDVVKYHQEFKKEKLIWKRVGSSLRFLFDDCGHLTLDTTYIATGERVKFLSGVLNSKLGNYLLKDAPTTGMSELQMTTVAMKPFRVPKISDENSPIVGNIEVLVDKIISAKTNSALDDSTRQAKIESHEKQIDQLVYQLYGLTKKDIDTVEKHHNKNSKKSAQRH